jgi:hypothetical protein
MKITQDAIVQDVRRNRDKLSAKFGYDLRAIVADIQTRQEANPHLVRRKSKRRARNS